LYRQGLKRLPRRRGDLDALNFTNALRKELTTYPEGATTDLVMADWEGEWNLRQILSLGPRETPRVEATLPPYLQRQQLEARRAELTPA
jgi:hypothetical protein